MKRFWRTYCKKDDGATAVEFALLALPFLLMIFGVMETGRIVWMVNSVEYALSDTARYASLNDDLTEGEFEAYAMERMDNMRIPGRDTFDITSSIVDINGIDFIQLDAIYSVDTMMTGFVPFADFDFDSSIRRPIYN